MSRWLLAVVIDRPDSECEANVRLIAAAPDLLAACKAYASVWPGDSTPHMVAIRAAIAKAEGR